MGSPWPRYNIHYESPGVPDPPPHSGFRDAHIKEEKVVVKLGTNVGNVLLVGMPTRYDDISTVGREETRKTRRETLHSRPDTRP